MDKQDEKNAIETALHGAIGRAVMDHAGPFLFSREMPMTAAIIGNIEQAAAAPELVECVRGWVEYMRNNGCDRDNVDWDKARAALKKAGVSV